MGSGRFHSIERDGWSFRLADATSEAPDTRESVIALAVNAAKGTAGARIRCSRHAETRLAKPGETEVFVKIISPPKGLVRLKRLIRGAPSDHVAAITAALRRDGFRAPAPILWGSEARSGRQVIVTARAKGTLLPRLLREGRCAIGAKRSMLRALGAEIARLHRAGYIHGDLTPFNIIVEEVSPDARFIFLDHERTRKTWLARFERPRLRNLVQLGHFDLLGVSRTDRMRVWRGYAEAQRAGRSRRQLRRLIRMIQTRLARDRRKMESPSEPVVPRREVGEV